MTIIHLPGIDSPPSLRDLLTAEYDALCSYVNLAEAEQAALIASDVDAMGVLASEKQIILSRVVKCRNATKRALGEPVTASALRDKLLDAGDGAREAFDLVITKAREASDLTHLSSKLVSHQTRRLNGRATALASAGIRSHGYGANGFDSLSGGLSSYGHA